jgi:hypothetical protein
MRRIALTLVLILATLAPAAPAPLPRRPARPDPGASQHLLALRVARLKELGVTWRTFERNGTVLRFRAAHRNGVIGGTIPVSEGGLTEALGQLICETEAFYLELERR